MISASCTITASRSKTIPAWAPPSTPVWLFSKRSWLPATKTPPCCSPSAETTATTTGRRFPKIRMPNMSRAHRSRCLWSLSAMPSAPFRIPAPRSPSPLCFQSMPSAICNRSRRAKTTTIFCTGWEMWSICTAGRNITAPWPVTWPGRSGAV